MKRPLTHVSKKRLLTFPVDAEKADFIAASKDENKRLHQARWHMIEELLEKEGYELVADLFEHSIKKRSTFAPDGR